MTASTAETLHQQAPLARSPHHFLSFLLLQVSPNGHLLPSGQKNYLQGPTAHPEIILFARHLLLQPKASFPPALTNHLAELSGAQLSCPTRTLDFAVFFILVPLH